MEQIVVSPADVGWLVESGILASALIFRSGGQAERAARRLAEACAWSGIGAEVLVRLRNGEIAGRLRYEPARRTPVLSFS